MTLFLGRFKKLLHGLGNAQQWTAMLPPDEYRKLRDRVDIEFDAAKMLGDIYEDHRQWDKAEELYKTIVAYDDSRAASFEYRRKHRSYCCCQRSAPSKAMPALRYLIAGRKAESEVARSAASRLTCVSRSLVSEVEINEDILFN